ncbi:MAG: putative quinol monooxygenase [Prevotella sp.]
MIRINCFVKLNDMAHRDEVIENAKQLVAATLANDKGCKGYDFFASTTRPDVFMFCETWESQELLDEHSRAPHFAKHVGAIEKLSTITIENMEK